jgi:branched-chain amino acid transport system permease protein
LKLKEKKYKVALFALLTAVGLILPLFLDNYIITVLALSITYGIIANGYNILLGYSGVFSFGHMAFAGLSGYICLILMTKANWPFSFAALAAVLIIAVVSAAFAYPAMGLRGFFFGVSTLAVGEIIILSLTNLDKLTGGTQGILLTKTPYLFGIELKGVEPLYYVAFVFFLLTLLLSVKRAYRFCRILKCRVVFIHHKMSYYCCNRFFYPP